MSVDWSKPIEAVEKATDRVVTVSYDGREWSESYNCFMYFTNEVPASDTTNEYWHEDGRDWCVSNKWFVRNCVEEVLPIDWTKPLELEDGTPVKVVYGPDSDGDYQLTRVDGKNFTKAQTDTLTRTAHWQENGARMQACKGIRVRNRVEQPATPTVDLPTMTVTGLPVPQGFADVMKHTVVGADITGILITAGDRMEITTTSGATFVVSISTK